MYTQKNLSLYSINSLNNVNSECTSDILDYYTDTDNKRYEILNDKGDILDYYTDEILNDKGDILDYYTAEILNDKEIYKDNYKHFTLKLPLTYEQQLTLKTQWNTQLNEIKQAKHTKHKTKLTFFKTLINK